MTANEIDIFIEEMDHMGDHWEKDQVENVYGDRSLEDALDDRKSSIAAYNQIIATIISNN
ncbi:MAG: hypothetical protein K6C68_11225 [Ruminococcus sp.]|nr:hypothetical protein [Ruminococcus sp.]